MQFELVQEARRQAEICNACRYCEGYCSVFPELHANRAFSEGDLTQLANLCHNCRGCYYACQYTAPHEFDLNLPKALAELRRDSWENFAWPEPLARRFHQHGAAIVLALIIGCAILLFAIMTTGPSGGDGFYAALPHTAMVAIFLPAFLFPLFSIAISLRRYWRFVGGGTIGLRNIKEAAKRIGNMKDLAAGHGDGCNFEEEDRFSHARRYAHQAVMAGFLLCFASTSAGTVLHYIFDRPAPYPLWSAPKLLGVSGGVLMTLGCGWMMALKLRSDRALGDAAAWGGDMAFIALLGIVAFSGLVLYLFGATPALPFLLAVHLGAVLSFFLLMPFTKMAHGFYRLFAILKVADGR